MLHTFFSWHLRGRDYTAHNGDQCRAEGVIGFFEGKRLKFQLQIRCVVGYADKQNRVHDNGERKVDRQRLCASGKGQWPDPRREKGGGLRDMLAQGDWMGQLQNFTARKITNVSYSQHSNCGVESLQHLLLTCLFWIRLVRTDNSVEILVGRGEIREMTS